MLSRLTVRDLATLARIDVELPPGLVVFTGETGAGKSLLVESLRFALGGRSRGGTLVREGADRAEVVAHFTVPKGHPVRVPLAEQELVDPDDDDSLLLRRIVRPGGRSVFQINGVTVPLRSLQPLKPWLADLTSQHEHVRLLDPKTHREVVDSLPGVSGALATYRSVFSAWRKAADDLAELEDRAHSRAERMAWLDHLLEDADDLAPEPDEEIRPASQWQRMCHSEEIQASASRLYALLAGAGDDDSGASAESLLSNAATILRQLERLDPTGADALAAQLNGVLVDLQDLATSVLHYGEEIDADPATRAAMETRLEQLQKLRRQFACEPEELHARIDDARAERDELEGLESQVEAARTAVSTAREAVQTTGDALAKARAAAVPDLTRIVEAHLQQLHMPDARLKVVWTSLPEPGPDGLHDLRLHAQTNPGEGFHPLDRTASGGELSRLLLAIKPAVRGGDSVLTTVFDEVDTGISGAAAVAVGRLLRELAGSGSGPGQVLCVSHLPQIAAAADHHLHVTKEVKRGRTFTTVEEVTGARRLEILSTMLGGDTTDAALAHAEELLRRSRGA